jgi:hypothetical protein
MQQERMVARWDGATVQITEIFKSDDNNWSMQCLYYHVRGYTYAIILGFNLYKYLIMQ